MPSLVKISQVVLKKIFKFRQCIFAIWLLSPLGKRWVPLVEQTWVFIIKNALCQVWLKLAKWFWRRRFFNFVNEFSLFRNYRRRQRRTTDKFWLEKITQAFGSGELKIRPLIEITFTQDLIFHLVCSMSNQYF